MTRSAAPYELVDGTRIADDWSDLVDGSLDAPLCVDENGLDRNGAGAWSNTDGRGRRNADERFCAGWDTVGALGAWAYCMLDGADWTWGRNVSLCELAHRLYCFET